VLRLIKLWLKAPIEERDGDGRRRIVGGKMNKRGTPQGGVASPLLANIYMNRFLKHWRLTGRGEAFRAHVVSYADDFVILSRGCATEALAWTKAVMTRLGLPLNEAKTSLRDARQERFTFLGYPFGPHWYKANGQWYLGTTRPRRACNGSRQQWATCWCPATTPHGRKCATRLTDLCAVGRTTFATGRAGQHSAVLTAIPTSACVTSSQDGTKWQGATG
jgi:RNA-directed DNA polymerase